MRIQMTVEIEVPGFEGDLPEGFNNDIVEVYGIYDATVDFKGMRYEVTEPN